VKLTKKQRTAIGIASAYWRSMLDAAFSYETPPITAMQNAIRERVRWVVLLARYRPKTSNEATR
jgi:hypothetical protein